MPDWFESSLGRFLLEQERRHCRVLTPSGYYPNRLQAGRASMDFLDGIESGNRFFIDDATGFEAAAGRDETARHAHCAIAKASAMPFGERAHNLIVLPHTLDFCDDPHAVLREVDHILAPPGCVIITGFNPISLWGAARLLMRSAKRRPWNGRYCRVGQLQDWLSLLGFELVGATMLAYLPPLQNPEWRRKLGFIEQAGARWWPGFGAVYVIVGRKRAAAPSGRAAVRSPWRRLIPDLARPAAQHAAAKANRAKPRRRLRRP